MKAEKNGEKLLTIAKEIQPVISVSYIVAVGIGMLFNFQKYSRFNINIFEYADIFDFLLAPFADFQIITFTIGSIVIAYLAFQSDIYWERKYPKSYGRMSFGLHQKRWYSWFRYGTAAFILVLYLYLSAKFYGKVSMNQTKKRPEIELVFADDKTEKGIIIGKTKDVIFLLTGEEVKAIPISSHVKEFQIK